MTGSVECEAARFQSQLRSLVRSRVLETVEEHDAARRPDAKKVGGLGHTREVGREAETPVPAEARRKVEIRQKVGLLSRNLAASQPDVILSLLELDVAVECYGDSVVEADWLPLPERLQPSGDDQQTERQRHETNNFHGHGIRESIVLAR